MDAQAAELTIKAYLTEVRDRLDKAAGIARAAYACAGAGYRGCRYRTCQQDLFPPPSLWKSARAAIQPNDAQSAALDDLANASHTADETIRNSCPKDVAMTAPSRLATMDQRIEAMRSAVTTVQPALDKFYGLLTDEQKAKITALAADKQPARREDLPSNGNCNGTQPGATDWPGEQIERSVKPTDAQRASLTELQDAAAKAADILKSSCPPADARTPPARLAAAGTRLDAMLQAILTVRPALDNFYNSLTDEQKAAFDAIGPERNGAATALAADRDESPRRHHGGHRHGYSVGGMIFPMMGL